MTRHRQPIAALDPAAAVLLNTTLRYLESTSGAGSNGSYHEGNATKATMMSSIFDNDSDVARWTDTSTLYRLVGARTCPASITSRPCSTQLGNSTSRYSSTVLAEDGVPLYLPIAYVSMAFGCMFFFIALAYFYLLKAN